MDITDYHVVTIAKILSGKHFPLSRQNLMVLSYYSSLSRTQPRLHRLHRKVPRPPRPKRRQKKRRRQNVPRQPRPRPRPRLQKKRRHEKENPRCRRVRRAESIWTYLVPSVVMAGATCIECQWMDPGTTLGTCGNSISPYPAPATMLASALQPLSHRRYFFFVISSLMTAVPVGRFYQEFLFIAIPVHVVP